MKRTLVLVVGAILLVSLGSPLVGQERVRDEQLVYSIVAFSGSDYARTFAREGADAVYLQADEDNFLIPAKTFVYYWPITQTWRTDTATLNVELAGTLEVVDPSGAVSSLMRTPFTYVNVRGEYEAQWVVAQGEDAYELYAEYEASIAAYREATEVYQADLDAYEQMFSELTQSIRRLRDRGDDVSEFVRMLERIEPPVEPVYTGNYLNPPAPITEGFVVNLPRGEYRMQFRDPSGAVMQGSERRLVVFEKQRTDGVGVEVIPADRWTRPVESRTQASVLYVNGAADLYLRPYFQHEYNDLYYEKMRRNDARGNPNIDKWVRIRQIPQAGIRVSRSGGETTLVEEAPYYVQQLEGAALGYRIVRFDPEGAHRGRNPSLIAYRVPLGPDDSIVELQLLDREGDPLSRGSRQIRVVNTDRGGALALVLALLPVLVMIGVLVRRSRVYKA